MTTANCVKWHTAMTLSVLLATGCTVGPRSTAPLPLDTAGPQTRRVTFIQWTDPHVFDAGTGRHGEGVQEEELDNWSAFHWAVLETNRLILAEHRTIDFVVITGDFGLENVQLPEVKGVAVKACDCPRRKPGEEGPIDKVPLELAATEIARELSALVVKRVYLVPGESDLCRGDANDVHRWARFVLAIPEGIAVQSQARSTSLKESSRLSGKAVGVPLKPEVVDLTYSLNRLFYIQKDPRVVNLFIDEGRPKPDPVPANAPAVNGIYLLGLNSAFFKGSAGAAMSDEINFVAERIHPGGSYLLFTHVPALQDPEYKSTGQEKQQGGTSKLNSLRPAETSTTKAVREGAINKGIVESASTSLWRLPEATAKKWNVEILNRSEVLGIFAGHFHTGSRDTYPHNFASAKPDEMTATKLWLAPPLAEKSQWRVPPDKTARGMLLVSINADGDARVSLKDDENVEPSAIWFSTLDQKAATAGDDKLAQAHAAEQEGQWEAAATKYLEALAVTGIDSRTRASALSGFARAHGVVERWWWRSPLSRWLYLNAWPLLYSLAVAFALLFVYAVLRWVRFFRIVSALTKRLVVPRFRGVATIAATVKMTADAPADEFAAQVLAAGEEIRIRLLQEQETWAARHISLLAPAASSFDSLLGSIPKVQSIDVSAWAKFIANLFQTCRWSVQTGLAVFPPDHGAAPATPIAPGTAPTLPQDGELSAYAVLQWAWMVKNSWRRKMKVGNDRSALRDLARQLAELILGEAFV